MRCKVVCIGKIRFGDTGADIQLNFSPVYGGSDENKEFFKYTPGGLMYLNVVNQSTADKFEVGAEYYVDFSAVL